METKSKYKLISIISTLVLLVFSIFLSASCKKGGGGGLGVLALMTPATSETPPAALATPTGVSATNTFTDQVTITWSAVPNARFYNVYRNDTGGVPLGENNVASYNDTTVIQGVKYTYKVEAGWRSTSDPTVVLSAMSAEHQGYAMLNTPTNVSATNNSGEKVTVTWNTVDHATTYHILRSMTQTGSYTDIATSPSPYDDTTAVAGTKYYYKVVAYSPDDVPGLESTTANGYRCTAAPGNFIASDGNFYSYVKLTWLPAAGSPTGYEIRRNGVLIDTTLIRDYNDTGAAAGPSNSSYQVVALYSNGTKSLPAEDTGYKHDPSTTIPCAVSWTANREKAVNSSGGGYRVYYSTGHIPDTGFEGISHVDVPWVSGSLAPITTTVNLGPDTGTWYIRMVGYSALNSGSTSKPSTEKSVTIY
jgi:hypothetical protein